MRTMGMIMMLVLLPTMALAAEDLGTFCWNLNGLLDRLTISVLLMDPNADDPQNTPENVYTVATVWTAETLYRMVGSGGGSNSRLPSGLIQLGLNVGNWSSSFGGNPTCTALLLLDPNASLSGSWRINCSGGPGPRFLNAGTLTWDENCDGLVEGPLSVQSTPRYGAGQAESLLSRPLDEGGD